MSVFSQARVHKYLFVLGLAAALVQVLVAGPYFQKVASAISASEGTLYSSINGEQVVPFLSWANWIASTWWFPYILCAIASALGCGFGTGKKGFLLFGTLATWLSLTALDLFSVGLAEFGLSLACNLAGGFIISSWLYTIAVALPSVTSLLGKSRLARSFSAFAWPAFAGFLTSAFLYILLRAVLHPSLVDMTADVEVPFNGYYSTDFDLGCYELSQGSKPETSCGKTGDERLSQQLKLPNKEAKSFGLLSKIKDPENFIWLGRAEPLQLHWERKAPESSTATLKFADGCINPSQLKTVAKSDEGLRAAKSMDLDFGPGMFQIRPANKKAISRVEVDEKGFAQFSVSEDEGDSGKLKISRFATDAAITLYPSISGGQIEVGVWPFGENEQFIEHPRRALKIVSDHKARTILFDAPTKIEPGSRFNCRPLQVQSGPVSVNSPYMSLVLALSPKRSISYESFRKLDEIHAPKVGGWIQVDKVKHAGLEQFSEDGSLHAIFLNGAFSKLEADGKDVPRSSRAHVDLYGDLHASVRGQTLTISGSAVASYVNGRRVNMTRWEKLGDSFQLAILGVIPTLLALFWRRLQKFYAGANYPWAEF